MNMPANKKSNLTKSLSHSELSEYEVAALEALEQGIWTVISYICSISESEKGNELAVSIANVLNPSVKSIHEFDMERIIEAFGCEDIFASKYSKLSYSSDSLLSAVAFAESYMKWKPKYFRRSDNEAIQLAGIITGSSVALKVLEKTDSDLASDISNIVGVPIGFLDFESAFKHITA